MEFDLQVTNIINKKGIARASIGPRMNQEDACSHILFAS